VGEFELCKPHNPNRDRSPQLTKSPEDGVGSLDHGWVMRFAKFKRPHYGPAIKRERETVGIQLRPPHNDAMQLVCSSSFQWLSGKSI